MQILFIYCFMCGAGNFISVYFPFRIERDTLRSQQKGIVPFLVTVVFAALIGLLILPAMFCLTVDKYLPLLLGIEGLPAGLLLALFFLALLPQFVDPGAGRVAAQTLALGLVFVVLAFATGSLWALTAGAASRFPPRENSRAGIAVSARGRRHDRNVMTATTPCEDARLPTGRDRRRGPPGGELRFESGAIGPCSPVAVGIAHLDRVAPRAASVNP